MIRRRHRRDLIVPIRDRRQHKRYLTLRNARRVILVLLLAFIAISVWSEVRPHVRGGYGRLLDRALPEVEQKPIEVVREETPPPAPITVAEDFVEPVIVEGTATIAPPPIEAADLSRAGNSRIAIVGGPEGVTIVRTAPRRAPLKGGFGRPSTD